jgi:hypothetical protein
MPSPKIDSHGSFLRLYVECEEFLHVFLRLLLPTLDHAHGQTKQDSLFGDVKAPTFIGGLMCTGRPEYLSSQW